MSQQFPSAPPPDGVIRKMHRSLDGSTMAMVALGVPKLLASLGLVVWLAVSLGGAWTPLIIVGWLASGVLIFVRPVEYLLARLYFRVSVPTPGELEYLKRLWENVTARAGVNPHRYSLWTDQDEDINAFAASAHIVSSTRWAMESLPPREMEAILAHELGHHLRGHSWSILVMGWYSWPIVVALRVVTATMKIGRSVLGFLLLVGACIAGGLIFNEAVPGYVALIVMLTPVLWIAGFFLLLFERLAGRLAEMAADRVAVQLGYGQDLLRGLHRFMSMEDRSQRPSWFARLVSTHPPTRNRVRALELRVGPLQVGPNTFGGAPPTGQQTGPQPPNWNQPYRR